LVKAMSLFLVASVAGGDCFNEAHHLLIFVSIDGFDCDFILFKRDDGIFIVSVDRLPS